jgi:hypothetical protein
MTGEWLVKSSDSVNLNITCATSASESPIWRLKPEEYRKPSPHQRGGWSLLTLTTLRPTFMSSRVSSPKEEREIIDHMANNGTV